MSEQLYYKLLKSTFENALLHLYFKVSASQSFVKEEQRNKILIDFLKPKLKVICSSQTGHFIKRHFAVQS
ncbi:TPA: DUF2913 family protein [Vibrio parahaemolyticus]|nr:DUF2913 family protein [Vibrio parahaemolyticus]HCG5726906.1 DUF2913 family protein [Vibrio parahaemolyticus]